MGGFYLGNGGGSGTGHSRRVVDSSALEVLGLADVVGTDLGQVEAEGLQQVQLAGGDFGSLAQNVPLDMFSAGGLGVGTSVFEEGVVSASLASHEVFEVELGGGRIVLAL